MALNKELAKITAGIQKKYGKEMAAIASEATGREIATHSTGSLMLDLALGSHSRSGFPEGRLIELYGPESAGKTTTILLAIAARQREEEEKSIADPSYSKRTCAFLDAEHALDFDLAEQYGVDLSELIYINPKTAEQGLDVLDLYIRSGQLCLAVIDSVPALVPASIEQASFEQKEMATLARFMSTVCQKMSGPAFLNDCTVIFINQIREKIGVWSPTGIAEGTPGGRALKYYSSIRMTVRAGERIKDGDDVIGQMVTC